jgi:hypothetical protein
MSSYHVKFLFEDDQFLVYDGKDIIAEGLTAEAALLRALEGERERLAEAQAWEVEVRRQWCILLERNQVMGEALEVFADETNWERRRELEPPTWDGEGDPVTIAQEALIPTPTAPRST